MGTVVWRTFTGSKGRKEKRHAAVYDFKPLYDRVRYGDGDREELSRREVKKGKEDPRNTDIEKLESGLSEESGGGGRRLEQHN